MENFDFIIIGAGAAGGAEDAGGDDEATQPYHDEGQRLPAGDPGHLSQLASKTAMSARVHSVLLRFRHHVGYCKPVLRAQSGSAPSRRHFFLMHGSSCDSWWL